MPKYYLARADYMKYRTLDNYGETLGAQAYYSSDFGSGSSRKIDTAKYDLAFSASPQQKKKPIPDFPSFSGLLFCPSSVFENVFERLLANFVVKFSFQVSGADYIGFRPSIFIAGLIDMQNSKYLTGPISGPYAFSRIILTKGPKDDIPIFACSDFKSTIFQPIVSEEFIETYKSADLTGLVFHPVFLEDRLP